MENFMDGKLYAKFMVGFCPKCCFDGICFMGKHLIFDGRIKSFV